MPISRFKAPIRATLALTFAMLFILATTSLALANLSLVRLSSDPYTNTTSQHKTEVEPDTFSFGSTIVSTFQVGRFFNGGSSNIGWATSTNNGSSWKHGFLPGITKIVNPANPYDRVSDPSVAFDAKHGVWLIASLPLLQSGGSVNGAAVIVNRSTNGGTTWGNPVTVHKATGSQNLDKNWIVCDDTSSSPFFGHCYVEWDDNGNNNLVQMSTSTDGGLTWSAPQTTADHAIVIGGQPLVQPNGTVIVPIDDAFESRVLAFTSTDGGTSWNATVTVSAITSHSVAGGLRTGPLPSAEIDGAGTVYVVWQDCRFEAGCSANDIVMSTSTNGIAWTPPTRIPSDPVGSGVDHFIPGLAVDKSTSGSTAHLVLAFYYYPNANCSASTCKLDVGFSSSKDGGATWSSTTQITGPMTLSWLASTSQGRMVGDYISTSFNSAGVAFPVFAVAKAPTGSTFHENMKTVTTGLTASGGHNSSKGDRILVTSRPTSSTRLTSR